MPPRTSQVDEIMKEVRDILALSNEVIDRSQCALWWSNGVLDCLIGQFNAPDALQEQACYQAYLDGIEVTMIARNKAALALGVVALSAATSRVTPDIHQF